MYFTYILDGAGSSHPVPIKRLVGFERSRLLPGGSATVGFSIPKASLSLVTADGSKKLYPGAAHPPSPFSDVLLTSRCGGWLCDDAGSHELVFSRGNGADVRIAVIV
eukprot:COSAG03_NODE_9635_length_704_cov_0.975207_1_plen_107_part_00